MGNALFLQFCKQNNILVSSLLTSILDCNRLIKNVVFFRRQIKAHIKQAACGKKFAYANFFTATLCRVLQLVAKAAGGERKRLW
jgi:hypothetical protein